jgi:hypothetical protein
MYRNRIQEDRGMTRPGPNGCFYYLVRARQPHAGSWGVDSGAAERTANCP